MEHSPVQATFVGYKHEKHDHLLPDGSAKAFEATIARLRQYKEEVQTEIDYEALTEEGKLDYDLVLHFLEYTLFDMTEIADWRSGHPFGSSGPIGGIGNAVFPLYTRDFAPLETRVKAIIGRLKRTPQFLEETKTLWQSPVKLWTQLAIEEGPMTVGFLQLIQHTLKPQLDATLHKELEEAIGAASEAINKYVEWLKSDVLPRSTHDWVLGAAKFVKLIELRRLGKTPQEILALGQQAFDDTKETLAKLAEELHPGKSVKEVRELITRDHPLSFDEILQHIANLTKEARAFIIAHNLMDVPENESIRVVPTPSFLTPIIPTAAYLSPEIFSPKQEGQYWVTITEGSEERLKAHSRAGSKNTAVHEAYPGHHLQIVSANLQPNLIRKITSMVAHETVEGWAHYCEQLMAEKGFLGKTEVFMQLAGQLFRAMRIIIDIKLHTGQMTIDEAKAFMIEETGMLENIAVAELNRYTSTPSYPLSYLLGKLMLLELRDEIQSQMGDQYSDQFFHNTILHSGGIPIHFLRKLFQLRIAQLAKD